MIYLWAYLAAGVVVAIWLYVAKFRKASGAPVPERVFAVKRADLLEKLTVAQIEARERVQDPLGAVPDLPFGHLHAAWQVFLAECQPGDKLWSFSARWPGDWRGEEQREGYVRVRLTGPGPAFETVRRSLAEPDGGMPKAQEPLPQTRRWPWWQRKLGPY